MSAKQSAQFERRLLPYKGVAVYLGVSERQAKELAARGELIKIPIGARVLFDRVDLDAYIERVKRSS